MAVYEANTRSLAQYISDTKLGFNPESVKSTTGYRVSGNRYLIEAKSIQCDRIYVVNDCFIEANGNIVVTSYVPAVKYCMISNELSECYNRGANLSFEYHASSQVLRYEIDKNTMLETYADFENCMECLIKFIGINIEKSINEFKGSWKLEDIVCDIQWQVDRIKRQ